jgi:hypothetical protein
MSSVLEIGRMEDIGGRCEDARGNKWERDPEV